MGTDDRRKTNRRLLNLPTALICRAGEKPLPGLLIHKTININYTIIAVTRARRTIPRRHSNDDVATNSAVARASDTTKARTAATFGCMGTSLFHWQLAIILLRLVILSLTLAAVISSCHIYALSRLSPWKSVNLLSFPSTA